MLCKRFPYLFFIVTLLLVPFGDIVHFAYHNINRWLFPFCAGIIWSIKIPQGYKITNKRKYFLLLPIVLILCCVLVYFRQNRIVPYFTGIAVDGLLALVISMLVIMLIRNLPVVNVVFSFLGKHSANMYMVHTFLFLYWFPQFIYAPKYAILIFLLLLLCSLAISLALEFIKTKSGIYKLSDYVVRKIDAL